jgi:hypothetical protein
MEQEIFKSNALYKMGHQIHLADGTKIFHTNVDAKSMLQTMVYERKIIFSLG